MNAPPPPAPPPLPLTVWLTAMLLHFWHYGYGYASGDQDEVLPYLLHRLNPQLFTADWFVQAQAAALTVRDPTIWLLEALAYVLPLWLAFLGLYLVVWFAITHGVYRLVWTFVPNPAIAAASTVLTLGVFTLWTLGGNDLVYDRFTPELLGWAMALPAFRWFLLHRYVGAGLWLGGATVFHPLVGLLTAFALGLTVLARADVRATLRFGLAYACVGGPVVAFFALGQTGTAAATTEELFYITAAFRNPHHYLPFSFGLRAYLAFAALTAAGLWGYHQLGKHKALAHAVTLRTFVGVVVGLLLLATLAAEGLALLPVAKLQFFKLTVWLKTLWVLLACGGLWFVLPAAWRDRIEGWSADTPWSLALVLVAWTCTLGLSTGGTGRAGRLVEPWVHQASALGQVEAWARSSTPLEAVFAVPPSNDTFRSNAHRGIAINRKAFPFDDTLLPDWFARIQAFAPMPLPERGTGLAPQLDAAYHQLSVSDWRRLTARYALDFALIDTAQRAGPLPFDPAFSAGTWVLYRLPALAPTTRPEEDVASLRPSHRHR